MESSTSFRGLGDCASAKVLSKESLDCLSHTTLYINERETSNGSPTIRSPGNKNHQSDADGHSRSLSVYFAIKDRRKDCEPHSQKKMKLLNRNSNGTTSDRQRYVLHKALAGHRGPVACLAAHPLGTYVSCGGKLFPDFTYLSLISWVKEKSAQTFGTYLVRNCCIRPWVPQIEVLLQPSYGSQGQTTQRTGSHTEPKTAISVFGKEQEAR